MTNSVPQEPLAPALDHLHSADVLRAVTRLGEQEVEQLSRATRVVLRRGDDERVIRTQQGTYLTIQDPGSGRTTVRLFEGPALREILLVAVDHYVDREFEIAEWTLAESAEAEALESELLEALGRGQPETALRIGRELVVRLPDDARLSALAVGAAVAQRGYAQSVALAQRSVALAEEPDWALRQLAAVLGAAGHRQQCLGVLLYLREHYGADAMTAEAWTQLAGCFVGPLHRPSIAETLIQQGLAACPDHDGLRHLRARARFDAADFPGALELLAPGLATPTPSSQTLTLALQAHLEGGLEGTEALAQRAAKLHPSSGLVRALALEVADRPGPSLKEYRGLLADAAGPAAALELRLHAMGAALRVGAYEDALKLAREAQTEIGEPDPRCLSVIYDSLRALEPNEDREDLADMATEARREAAEATLDRETALRAMLSTGIYLDPVALAPLWEELALGATDDPDGLRPQPPQLAEGLLCVATQTGFVALFDELGLTARLASAAWDWFSNEAVLRTEREAGRVAVAAGESPVLWVRVTTAPLHPADHHRFQRLTPQPFTVTSGRVFLGPGEALHGGAEADAQASHTLGQELGGRSFYLAPGRYRVTPYQRTIQPWPADDVRTDPCDVIFHIQKG